MPNMLLGIIKSDGFRDVVCFRARASVSAHVNSLSISIKTLISCLSLGQRRAFPSRMYVRSVQSELERRLARHAAWWRAGAFALVRGAY